MQLQYFTCLLNITVLLLLVCRLFFKSNSGMYCGFGVMVMLVCQLVPTDISQQVLVGLS